MQLTHAPQRLFALLAAAILALPISAAPAGAAPAPVRLDDEVTQRLQTTADTQRIPVIIEGAPDRGAQTSGANRAQRAEDRVRSTGGHVVGTSSLLGASVAELTPAEIRTLAADASAQYTRVAPDAALMSVRVLDAQRISRLSTVILGLEWVDAHKSSLGIRVVVMALGAPAVGSYREDPLAAAAELAWRSGLVLVTAAGNAGPGAGTIQTPGIDPLVLTVGASDDNGTAAPSDDSMPTW